jgi:hypothetical protein
LTEKTCPNCEDQDCEKGTDLCEGCERCKECFGTGIVEYQIAVDDFKDVACELCNDGGDDDSDRAYDAWKDDQLTGDIEE